MTTDELIRALIALWATEVRWRQRAELVTDATLEHAGEEKWTLIGQIKSLEWRVRLCEVNHKNQGSLWEPMSNPLTWATG